MEYQDIVDAATAYADRNDVEVDKNMDMFFIMAEARINRALKIAEQTHRVYTSANGTEFYTLPSDYNGMRIIQHKVGDKATVINFVPPSQINDKSESKLNYTIINNQIQLSRKISDSLVEMVFYRKVPHLSHKNKNNWVSDNHPDIYLAGLCTEIELFVKNYEAADIWNARMTDAINSIGENDTTTRWAGGPLVIRGDYHD